MEPTQSLREDRRGAIVVVAVFMAAFLVGVLWYLIGIGDAIVYRQQMQAGADATAYASAVYHARGMNMIAMINLNMAAIIALLVAAKTLKMLVGIVYTGAIVSCTLSQKLVPKKFDGCTEAQQASQLITKIAGLITTIEGVGDSTLKSLSNSQKEIAVVTPWIAFTRSGIDAKNYAPSVVSGAATSMSMVPKGDRLGLPVVEEDFEVACDRGRKVVNVLVDQLIPPNFDYFLGGFMGGMLGLDKGGDYPAKYCQGDNVGIKLEPDFDQEKLCKEAIPKADGESHKDYKEKIEDCVENPPDDGGEWDIPKPDLTETAPIPDKDKTTKKIFDEAYNGNDYFQVYGLARGMSSRLTKADKGVEIAGWQKSLVGAPDPLEAIAVAQAEFYYDQVPNLPQKFPECWTPQCGLGWASYKENVLWNMRWRARLRRYRAPGANVDVDVIAEGVSAGGQGVIGQYKNVANEVGLLGAGAVLEAEKPIIH